MNAISIPVAVMVGITLYVGFNHLFIYIQRSESRVDLTFALTCFSMAAYQVFCIGLYNSPSIMASESWERGQLIAICCFGISFLFFVHDYLSIKVPKAVYLFVVFFTASMIIQFVDRSDFTWIQSSPSVKTVYLPYRFSVIYRELLPGIGTVPVYAAGIAMFVYTLGRAVRAYRTRGMARARALIASVVLYFAGSISDILLSLGFTHFIYTGEYAFLGIVVLMARSMYMELIEAGKYKKSLEESEEIFKNIVRLTPYPIAIIGKHERFEYFNPKFIEIFGYSLEEITGTDDWFRMAYPDPHYRESVYRSWKAGETAHERALIGRREYSVTCGDGTVRHVIFRVLTIPTGKRFVIFEDITESRKTELELRESEERYRMIYENATEVIFLLDGKRFITYISPYCERILGYRPDELMGKRLNETAIIAKESLEPVMNLMARILGGETVTSFNFKCITKSGSVRYGEMSASPLMRDGLVTGMVGFVNDITERKTAQDTIIKRDRILGAVSRAANILLRSRNLDGAIDEMLSTLGKATQLSRIIIYRNVYGEDGDRIIMRRYSWHSMESGGAYSADLDGVSYDMFPRWHLNLSQDEIIHGLAGDFSDSEKSLLDLQGILSVVMVPVFASDQWWGFIEFDDCATSKEWNPIEIEVLKSAATIIGSSLERMRTEEELLKTSKIESLGVFAGGIAHDFNNLLTAVIGNMSLARMQIPEGSEVHGILADAERASQRTRELTQQLLTFSKGGMPIKETSSIKNLLIDTAQFVLSGTNFQREFDIHEGLWNARIDRGQISQVIHNVILNARQSMQDSGLITISAENFFASSPDENRLAPGCYVKISVRDQGEGIARKNLQNIFDPYFTTKKDGSGLGLSISYSIVKKHGGHIAVQSEPGRGSRFDIYLPATEDKVDAADALRTDAGILQGRALVMDDEAGVLKVAERMLTKLGFTVTCVRDGMEAVESYGNAVLSGAPFDVVIMDLTVPGGTGGHEATRILRERYPGAKVIVSSGYSNDPVMADYERHGFVGVIVKPYRYEEMSDTVRRVMNL